MSSEYPWKDRKNLNFCTKCGVGEHNLEDFPIMLDNINNEKNVNLLSGLPKHEALHSKNLHIFTIQGINIGSGKPHITKNQSKEYSYPNTYKQMNFLNNAKKYLKNLHMKKTLHSL